MELAAGYAEILQTDNWGRYKSEATEKSRVTNSYNVIRSYL